MAMVKRVVMFSGGIASWATAKMVANQFGNDNLYLVFADVKGNNESPHVGEDEDTYKFIEAAAKNIGGTLVYLNTGMDIWQLFKERNFLSNSRIAHCSMYLKQRPARKWLKANCSPEDTIVYVGIDWTETHRLPAILKNYLPYKVEAPLTEPPYMDKEQMIYAAKKEGLPIPRLYTLGFSHNNCGGGCVRAGQGQFKKLLEVMPERYEVWERKEQETITHIGKDVSILTEVVKGIKKPLTLMELRRRVEAKEKVDELDLGACGCFFQDDDRLEAEDNDGN